MSSYYYTFIYSTFLFTLILAGLIICYRMVTNKRPVVFVWGLFLGLILLDLTVFGASSMSYFTLPREDIRFNEHKSPIMIPEYRNERLYIADQFRYFKPALYEKFTAFDTDTIIRFRDREAKQLEVELVKVVDDIMDGNFPLQEDVLKSTVFDFIKNGAKLYDKWGVQQRKAYLNILEVLVENIALENNFYFTFSGIKERLFSIKAGIMEGYHFNNLNVEWTKKRQTVEVSLALLRFESGLSESVDRMQTFEFYSNNKRTISFQERLELHNYLFFELSVTDYLIYVRNRYCISDVTFVRFKQYDKMINMFDPTGFYPELPFVRKRMKADCGISLPMLQFYKNAEYIDKEDYWSLLKSAKLEFGTLYVHSSSQTARTDSLSKSQTKNSFLPEFSYTINEYNPNYLRISCTTDTDGYLYFSDQFDRYWQVSVNGVNQPLLKANGLFKAVKVPSDSSEIIFSYNPIYFRMSLWVYYSVSIICLVFLFLRRKRYRIKY